jgi:hypothetical protein
VGHSLIEQFVLGGEMLRQGLVGLTGEDLRAYPVPGTWSIQEIVIHLQDSDLIGCDRMKRIIAEPNPTLTAYDESLFIKNLFPDRQDAHRAAEILAQNRRQMAVILQSLPNEAFQRMGVHSEKGPVSLEATLKTYINHLEHHMTFLRDKRALLGKALMA